MILSNFCEKLLCGDIEKKKREWYNKAGYRDKTGSTAMEKIYAMNEIQAIVRPIPQDHDVSGRIFSVLMPVGAMKKNIDILEHIRIYCEDIEATTER